MIECSVNVQAPPLYTPDTYLNLRKKRILRQIDDNEWAKQLSSRETSRDKLMRKCRLDEFIIAVTKDCFELFLGKEWKPRSADFNDVLAQLDNARIYYNEQLVASEMRGSVNVQWVHT